MADDAGIGVLRRQVFEQGEPSSVQSSRTIGKTPNGRKS
jgi:hypothetical protein